LNIRQPNADEIASVRAIVQTVVDEVYGGLWADPPLPIDDEEWSRALAAFLDGRMVGIVLTHQQWISDLWVLAEARGQGIGQKLLLEAESEIGARGFTTMQLRVVKSNQVAVNFYRRQGWRQVREFPNEKLPVTMIEMAKSNRQK
jgi:ribosomal protein S18 acetylase RimI-like enzyme